MAKRKKPKIVYINEPGQDPPLPLKENSGPDGLEAVNPVDQPISGAIANGMKRSWNWLLTFAFSLICLVVLAAFILIPSDSSRLPKAAPQEALPNCLGFHPDSSWGHPLHELECTSGSLSEGQTLADLLLTWRVDYRRVIELLQVLGEQQMPQMSQGNPYVLLHSKGNPFEGKVFCYEPSPDKHVLLNLDGVPAVQLRMKKVVRHEKKVTEVVIKTTLAEEMFNRSFGLKMTRDLEEAMRHKLDLFYLEPGDQFRFLYDEVEYEGGHVEVGKVLGLQFNAPGKHLMAFYFPDEWKPGYYDLDGRSMDGGFLMAPLEFGRLTSPYNPMRPDPFSETGEIRPHLGTDYSAPEGTPILAVADGTVMEAEFRGNNGNYVKLHHSAEIQTQYLHMSAFAEGIEPGVEVRQGQVIGYVGSTGRSTGPHVCYRFWKNGQQVDHRKETDILLPVALDTETLMRYQMHRDSLMMMFGGI
jgi:murein DD-endopeptidase MepM/ murein hydrolase activator NlpD